MTRDREGHYVKIKRSIHQEDMAILNVHVQTTSCKLGEAKTEKRKRDSVILVNFNICPQQISKGIEFNTINHQSTGTNQHLENNLPNNSKIFFSPQNIY